MLTPRSTLARRVAAALDASPSRIPVLLVACGSGRTTLLYQLRDRIGRGASQYIDVERVATTPERFLRAMAAPSPFPAAPTAAATPSGARASFDATLAYLSQARTGGGEVRNKTRFPRLFRDDCGIPHGKRERRPTKKP